jgi:carbon-monoxide dehydrogenase medium subunit
MKNFEYHSPTTLSEACEILNKFKGSAKPLAGGTDLIPKIYHRQLAPEHLINLKNIPELNKITFDPSRGLELGPLVRFNDMIYSEIVQNNYPILLEISKRVASHQIRNLATVGGNLCNAAPSADSVPILIALNSKVVISGSDKKKREMALENFFHGPGETALEYGEILTKIKVPIIQPRTGMDYIKHTMRQALEIAIVGVAGLVRLNENYTTIEDVRVIIGACSPTPMRITSIEKDLLGSKITDRSINKAAKHAADAVKPISDVRGSDEYRREMSEVLTRRVLYSALERAKHG